MCLTNKVVILSAKLSTPKMVHDLVYVRDPALAGFRRSTLDVKFAKFKRQNEYRKCSDFLGNQKLAPLSARKIERALAALFVFLAECGGG